MARFVLDTSVTMAWCFEDEASGYADAILARIEDGDDVAVPSLWPLEVANVLLVGERRGRLTQAETALFIRLLGGLPISVEEDTPRHAFGAILALGRAHALSSYDAAYLELAMRLGLPLATSDVRLITAAATVGVPILNAVT